MTDVLHLEEAIRRSGKKKDYLAGRLGISRQAFYLKCTGKSFFISSEIKLLCEELDIGVEEREAIFFA